MGKWLQKQNFNLLLLHFSSLANNLIDLGFSFFSPAAESFSMRPALVDVVFDRGMRHPAGNNGLLLRCMGQLNHPVFARCSFHPLQSLRWSRTSTYSCVIYRGETWR